MLWRRMLMFTRYSTNQDMYSNKLRRVPFLLSIFCVVTYGQEWPRLLFHTGETCAIPCLAHGEHKDCFWRKGGHYDASEEIAYNIAGSLYSSSERYEVLSNGTLMIKNVTAEDEGKYFCLPASSKSSCYASVTVYVKVTVLPYIDLCSPRSSCTVYSKQDKTISLICYAKSVSSQMKVKWFNGSKEIVENVKITSGKNSRNETEISNKLTLTFQEATFLTCKAAHVKLENATAHVHLVPFEEDEHSVGLIVAVSILAVTLCLVLAATFSFILVKHYRRRESAFKPSEDEETDERVPMLQDQLTKIEKNLEEERGKLTGAVATVAAKEEALQTTKQMLHKKDQELEELRSDVKNKSEELNETKEMVTLLKEGTNSNLTDLKVEVAEKNAELKRLKKEVSEKDVKIKNIEEEVTAKDAIVTRLEKDVSEKDVKLKNIEEEVTAKDAIVTGLKKEVSEKDVKIKNIAKEVTAKDATVTRLEKDVSEKDVKLKNIEKEVTAKDATVTDLKKRLKASQERLKISMRDHEFSKRQLRFQILAAKDVYKHLCLLKIPPGTSNEFAERKSSTVLKLADAKYSYNYIFENNATNNEIYVQLEELIQNSIDGGNSCIFVLCSSTSDTASIVFDTENKADVGVIPKAIHKLFEMPSGWKEIGLSSDITVTYAVADTYGENKIASFKAEMVPIETADHAFKVLKEYKDNKQTVGDTSGNKKLAATNLFQFSINTKGEKRIYSTGMLMFCTFTNLELIKGCLQGKTERITEFTNHVTSAINAPGTKVAILSVFSEGNKEAAKYQLKFNEFITGEKKKWYQKRWHGRKNEENA